MGGGVGLLVNLANGDKLATDRTGGFSDTHIRIPWCLRRVGSGIRVRHEIMDYEGGRPDFLVVVGQCVRGELHGNYCFLLGV